MRLAIVDNGVVTNIITVSAGAVPPEYQDMPEATAAARIGGTWDAQNGFSPPAPKPITPDAVTAERERRLKAGTVITLAGYGNIAVQGRQQDMISYMALRDQARTLAANGETQSVLQFRDRDNVMHSLTPQQVIDLVGAGQAYASDVFAASWVLKDADPIPHDYADDAYWP